MEIRIFTYKTPKKGKYQGKSLSVEEIFASTRIAQNHHIFRPLMTNQLYIYLARGPTIKTIKIIADIKRISYIYPGRLTNVKPKTESIAEKGTGK